MHFTRLRLSDWRQFKSIDLDLSARTTIITGANGSGKSTVLRLLGQHFGWSNLLLSVPKQQKSGGLLYFTGLVKKISHALTPAVNNNLIDYSNQSTASIEIPEGGGAQYNIGIAGMPQMFGLLIGSHRIVQNYTSVASIPTGLINPSTAYSNYQSETISRYNGGYSQYSPMYRMKEALIAMATLGVGNKYNPTNVESVRLLEGFKNILSVVLPPSVGFKEFQIRLPEVVLITESGEFILDASSGGLASLIDISWQIFLYSQQSSEFTVLLDEPENHLHPSMQRNLLESLSHAFPNARFIVATHSPFIVSSLRNSKVYALTYSDISDEKLDRTRAVISVALSLDQKAATANEILRDVLGVPVSLPIWAEADLKEIVSRFNIKEISKENLDKLNSELKLAGLEEYYTDALNIMVKQFHDQTN